MALLVPWPLKLVVDNVLQAQPLPDALGDVFGWLAGNRSSLLVVAVAGGALVTFVHNALGVAEKYVNTTLEQRAVLDLRSDLFQHAQGLSLTFHDRRSTGDFMSRIHDQAVAVGKIPLTVPRLAKSVLTLLGMFWVAFRIDAELALLSLTVVPLLYYTTTRYTRSIKPRVHAVKEMEGQSLSMVQESLSMLRVILAFGREEYEHG
ncbi:MAG: ABC transporter ATP-binding protein, partial [Gammaproteobacteria bacterium]|nr:ABC transporter ATP-binding protein [Gammaproteobacteria bacterium]